MAEVGDAPAAPPETRRAVNRPRKGRHLGRGPIRLLIMLLVAWGIYAAFFRDF